MKRNQYGDIIFTSEEQKQMKQFRDAYQNGWSLETNDPEDEVETEDFINKYLIYFKEKREKELQKKAAERNKNFIQKLISLINKGK